MPVSKSYQKAVESEVWLSAQHLSRSPWIREEIKSIDVDDLIKTTGGSEQILGSLLPP
jgi:hypothetical protein